MIGGVVIKGIQKADIKDKNGKLHSVKSGKKWQVFLYAYNRIAASKYLNILLPCQDAFPEDVNPNDLFIDQSTSLPKNKI